MKHLSKTIKITGIILAIIIACVLLFLNGLFAPLIEEIINEKPEAKITAYLKAVEKDDAIKALTIWELPDWTNEEISLLENRRENLTKDLIKNKIKDFGILKIEWWNTCCEPSIINDSNWANGARVYVQLINSYNTKSFYIFDVFVSKGHREPGIGNSIRHWVIRDIYLENQEPLFWKF